MFRKLILAIILSIFISATATAADAVRINGLNVTGDLLYLFSEGEFAIGAGTTIATFYDLAEL